ncbi:MAG TPA: hypothetical protein VLX09_00670 [Stellaceae bacterium]|nr:hypothetical protein [Stellaceae bacterium]
MAYLIDTNIAIHARDGTDAVLVKLAASVLVTNNSADFSDIPGLSVENWLTGS